MIKGTKNTGGGDTPTTFTVTYNGNGNTSGTVPTDNTEYDANNNTVTVLGNTGNLAKEHYSFTGWNTVAGGTGTSYVEGNTFTISSNTSLYAQWAINTSNVTLPAADQYGTYTMSAENPIAYGTEVTLTYTPAEGYENYKATWSVNGEAIAANKFTMPDEAVEVTVSLKEVIDYVTLPFNWAGGDKETLMNVIGVTTYGLGNYADTHDPYLIKFDGSGDYIQIKTDSQPSKVIVGVKMIGGNNSTSIIVQGSADGETFTNVETLTISGSQNAILNLETNKSFNTTDRYVRLYFNKGSNGSNVGVGPITIAVPSTDTDPAISADATLSLAYDATSGEIAYSILNPVPGASMNATTTADWISDINVTTDKVTFTTTANTGEERTASITLTYSTVTKEITVTQAAYEDSNAPGTENNPYTVAQAIEYINTLGSNTSADDVYVSGIISQVDSYNSNYNSITYWISDDGNTTTQMQVYSGKGLNGANFKVVTDLAVGDIVTVKGKVKKYNSTPEFTQNNQLVSFERPVVPNITAENVELAYDATTGEIEYTINNEPSPAGELSAIVSEGTWLTISAVGQKVEVTCSANEAAAPRTAKVTLTYTYGDSKTTTKEVTVTQAGNPNVIDNISDITEVGEAYSVRGTVVATNNKGFIIGDGTGYVYYYNNAEVAQSVGDIVKISGTTGSYGHIIQFTNAATVTEETSSNYNNTPDVEVITALPDYSGDYYLSTYLEFEGALSVSGSTYLITLGESQIQISYPTTAQSTALAALNGKNVRVKGYFSGINSSNIFSVMLESVEEIVSTEPSLTVDASDKAINVNAAGTITNHEQQTIKVFYANLDAQSETIGVMYCDENDDELTTGGYDWITSITKDFVSDEYFTMACEFAANTESTPRTAYIKIYCGDVYSDLITITQAGFVIDYAELPFNWEGGSSSDFLKLKGVTAKGLGSDYSSHTPYAIKLDNDGDYIQIKTNRQPDVVTIGVKMIGGANDSKITVQGSADGKTFTKVEDLTISGAQNATLELETTKAFAETDRYVRLYFTKGANVGVGPISITAVGQPSISVKTTSVDVLAEGEDGTFEVKSKNVSDLDFAWYTDETATTTTTQPDWITINFSPTGSGDVEYSISANEGEARSAFLKIHGKDNADNDIYSEMVTITQAEYVIDYAELPFAWDDTTTPTGVRNSGVSTYGNSPYMKFDTTGDYIILKVNEAPEWLSFDIKGNTFSGGTFTVQTSADGRTYTDLATYTELGDTQSESFSDLGNIRYIKWIYTEKSAGNVALGNILVTKTKSVSVTSAGLATYCSTEALDFSNVEGLTAYKATLSGTELSFEKVTTVPAGTGVLLKGNEGTYQIPVIASAKTIENNVLVGVTESTGKSAGIFVLMNGDKGVGFYKTTKAFTVGANTAYIDDSSLPANVRFIGFDGETTGITTMTEMKTNGSIYNLNGQRVTTPKKGLYIMNGKKVVNK